MVTVNDFLSGAWPKKFHAVLRQHSQAKTSLDMLKDEGFEERILLEFLYRYSLPATRKYQRELRTYAGRVASQMIKLVPVMRRTADDVESARDVLSMRSTAWHSYVEFWVIEGLRNVAQRIDSLSHHYKSFSSQKGEARDEESLVFLCMLVQVKTGRKHWGDLAYLLEAAFRASGHREDWSEDSVRKVVQHYRESWPDVYRQMLDFVRDLYRDSSIPRPSGRSTRNRRFRRAHFEPITYRDPRNLGGAD